MKNAVIAVLDTDPVFLALMEELLTEEGYQPLLVSEEATALALLRRTLPALVIIDPWLRERRSGWEIITQLWADRATTHIPVIVASSDAPLSVEQAEVLRAMQYEVVQKPFDLDALLLLIATALGEEPREPRRLRPLVWPPMRDKQPDVILTGDA